MSDASAASGRRLGAGSTSLAPTVIIVGDEPRVVVTIARSLHRRGVRSIVAALNGPHFPLSSRAIAGVTRIGGTADDSAQLLCLLARSEGAAWVVPTSDSSLRVVCAAYDTLSRFCAVGCPPPHVVQRVLDKALTLEAAETVGVPIPTSLTIATAGDLDAILPRMQFPIIAKPSDKSQSTKHGFKKRTFKSSAELRHAFAAQSDFGSGLLFQTFHGGQGVGVEVLISRGQLVASFQHRRLSENPPSGGVAVVGIAEPVDPVLLGYAVRLLTALEWDGVAMVEFRHDPLTGEAVLMEVNGRFWGSLALAVAAGVDFPWYAWKASQSLPQEAQEPYRHGLRVCWTAGSLRRFAHAISKSDERTSIGAAITQLLADFRPGTRSALWAWSDPAPAMQDVAGLLREWSKEFIKRGIRAAVPSAALSIVSSARMLPADRPAST